MNKTSNSHIGFEILTKDKNFIVLKSVRENKRKKYLENINSSKLIMHYFDENDIKKLQKIENEIVLSIIYKRKKKSLFNKIKKILGRYKFYI